MELTTLWLCMTAAFLMVGLVAWLRPEWFLSYAWTLHPHHISPETIAHLRGKPNEDEAEADVVTERIELIGSGGIARGSHDIDPVALPPISTIVARCLPRHDAAR